MVYQINNDSGNDLTTGATTCCIGQVLGEDIVSFCKCAVLEQSITNIRPKGSWGGEEEGGGVRSGPGEARTILLLHIISARPSKQPVYGTYLPQVKVYMELGSSFFFLQEQIKDIIITAA